MAAMAFVYRIAALRDSGVERNKKAQCRATGGGAQCCRKASPSCSAADMLKLLRRRPAPPTWLRVQPIDATTATLTGKELDWIDPVAKRACVRGQEERQYIHGPRPFLPVVSAAQSLITAVNSGWDEDAGAEKRL